MKKSREEKAIEKQTKENKKNAKRQEIREIAKMIVSDQPVINGVKIMDQDAEMILKTIIDMYEQKEGNVINVPNERLPDYLREDVDVQYQKLRMYGMISNVSQWWGGAEITLTEKAKAYFEDKENALINQMNQKTKKKYDVFISHASKDKNEFVESLYDTVLALGIDVFYDKKSISWGDNWKDVILEGTSNSEFAIIVISENFFGREWTERELFEFLKQQNESGQKIVLPLLFNLTREKLLDHYPELTEIQYIDAQTVSKEEIVILLAKELIKRYKVIME